jgi:DNA-directed RNA polymerase sigma subunit (sigma70/sigma32)
MTKPGRPPLDDLDWMGLHGQYLHARADLWRRLERAPTNEEIADYLALSVRTVERLRSRVRGWRRSAAAVIGLEPSPETIDYLQDLWSWSDEDRIRRAYAAGDLTTAAAAERLASDDRNLRRWRARFRRAE